MKQDNVIKLKSLDFAVRIVNMTKYLLQHISFAEQPICKQLLKSGTSIGANIREAEHAESTEDFIHKMKIALKEANESEFWLELFYRTNYITKEQYESLIADCSEINKLLISIVKKTKENNKINN
jgi:four helix bundle protein